MRVNQLLMASWITMTAGMTAGLALAAGPGTPPPSRTDNVKDTVHGVTIVDPYRWLEGDNSDPKQMGAMTSEVAQWTDAQNAYTRNTLDNLPGRKAVEEALRPLMEVGSVSSPRMRGDRYFYSKREGTQNQASVYMRIGHDGEPKLLLDPAKIDPSGLTTISWTSPSHDGKLLAYGTYVAGDENSTLRIIDVDTGEHLTDVITGKVGGCDWMPDGKTFMYRNLADIKNPYSGQVMFHKLGQDQSADAQVFRQFTVEENAKLATTYGPYGALSEDGEWILLAYYTDTRNNDLWAVKTSDFLATGDAKRREILVGEQAQSFGPVIDGVLYMETTFEAPNGRVVAVDLAKPDRANWRELVPHREDAVIQGISAADGVIAVDYLVNASSTIELVGFDGTKKGQLKLPGIGSAGVSTNEDRTEAFLSFTSFNYPTSIFRVDLANPNAQPQLWERPDVPVNPESVTVKQEWYTSRDGTKVSMFIVHRKGLELNGDNPTLLYGYGGFNISLTPSFSASLFQWLDAGGVYVVANLRGGGEYGQAWHNSGKLENKQNVFDDFITAAEHLVSTGYTKPARLAIAGGSNGGLLTGAAVTQRPDLFGAVIIGVPLLDMIRYQNFLMARYWVPEYGSAEVAEQFSYIYKYSPYHNIKSGTKYPGIMITAGENDTRVHPLHARKMAAALQAATASDPAKKPVLLWVDREAGHGQGKPLNLRIREVADQRMFLMWQLGMLENAKADGAKANDAQAAADPAQPQIVLAVSNMTCSMCQAKVKKTLMAIDGVTDARVDLDEDRAYITLASPNAVKPPALISALEKAKFPAKVVSGR